MWLLVVSSTFSVKSVDNIDKKWLRRTMMNVH